MPGYQKRCGDCKQTKPVSEFFVRRASTDGLTAYCKDCCKERQKKYAGRYDGRYKGRYYQPKKDPAAPTTAELNKLPGYVNARNAWYRAKYNGRLPKWATFDSFLPFYVEAAERGLQVDHIVPLKHPLVCGLHTVTNLQLLEPIDNLLKSNRFSTS